MRLLLFDQKSHVYHSAALKANHMGVAIILTILHTESLCKHYLLTYLLTYLLIHQMHFDFSPRLPLRICLYTLFTNCCSKWRRKRMHTHTYFASTCAAGNHVTVGNQVRLTKAMAHSLIQVDCRR